MRRLIKSFKHAVAGIVCAVGTERNMRIHIVVATLIMPFAWVFGITPGEWAVLILTIGFVIAAELFNTATEKLSDAVTEDYNEFIKIAKDTAAGGVTVAAVTAIFVGVALFGNVGKIAETLVYIVTHVHTLAIFLIIFIIDICFLIKVKEKGKNNGKK